jgi:hypothetical protein
MAAILNEGTQYVDGGGKPLTGGSVYVGAPNADPVANPKSIFSDRELSVPLANPQLINANGRTVNKIWVDGGYSIQVNDINSAQVFQDLDSGTAAVSFDAVALTAIVGGNAITASATPTITSYVDKGLYIFTAAQANTGPVTLNVDNVGSKAVLANSNTPLGAGEFNEDDNITAMYNSSNDVFTLVSQKRGLDFDLTPTLSGTLEANGNQIRESKGSNLTAASTLSIPSSGNMFDVVGSTTINNLSNVGVGTTITLRFTSATILTDSATLNVQGEQDYAASIGDIAVATQIDSGPAVWTVSIFTIKGSPVVSPDTSERQEFTASGTWTKPALASASSMILVQAWGGGGGGSDAGATGGGGGGAYSEYWFASSAVSATESVVVGPASAILIDGTDSTFGSHLTAFGGSGSQTNDGGGGGGELDKTGTRDGGDIGGGDGSTGGPAENAKTIWGGGGGGDASADGHGGSAVFGGGGGSGNNSAARAGLSLNGGNGGTVGVGGSTPGGGGGAQGGTGGLGQVIVTTFI